VPQFPGPLPPAPAGSIRSFRTLKEGLAFIGRRPGMTLGLPFIVMAPVLLAVLAAFATSGSPVLGTLVQLVISLGWALVGMACLGAATVAAAPGQGEDGPPAGECLAAGFRKLPSYLLTIAVLVLCAFALSLILFIVIRVTAPALPQSAAMSMKDAGPAVVILSIAFGVAYLFVWISLCLTVPACCAEDLGAVDSLRRSWALTRGNRFKIFLVMILSGIVFGLAMFVVSLIVTLAVSGPVDFQRSPGAAAFLVFVQYMLLMILSFVMTPAVYWACRAREDGARLNDYSEVF
jgi:hypothetical protein